MENNTDRNEKEKTAELFNIFSQAEVKELENLLVMSEDREQKIFYRMLINLKLQFEQEKIIGEPLV